MFKKVLLAHDGSDCSQEAFRLALEIAREDRADLAIVHVVDITKATSVISGDASLAQPWLDALDREGDDVLARLQAEAQTRGVRVRVYKAHDAPARAITHLAESLDCDVIVMGTHGRAGISRLVLGSVAEQVIESVDVPVLIAPLKVLARVKRQRAPSSIPLPVL